MTLADELLRCCKKTPRELAKSLSLDGKNHREIGEALGVSKATARRWVLDISQAKG